MKKQYVEPKMEVEMIETELPIAQSPMIVDSDPDNMLSEEEIFVKDRNIFDLDF